MSVRDQAPGERAGRLVTWGNRMRVIAGVLLALPLVTRSLAAQVTEPSRRSTGSISGIVFDSLARRPLAGALVQLVATDSLDRFTRSSVADSVGRFLLAGIPDGRYTIGFFHDMVDSLGLEAPLKAVVMEGSRALRTDLGLPSPARLRGIICGARPAPVAQIDSGTVVLGFVRDARTSAAIAGASVSAEWMEMSFTNTGLVRRSPRLVATSAVNGWFAICNAPGSGIVGLLATRGADSSDRLDIEMTSTGFLRRDIYLGPPPIVVRRDTVATPGTTAGIAANTTRAGDGRATGNVVTADSGRAIPDAVVGIVGGSHTRTNARGEWALANVPSGTRMLDVRAVGYYPSRRPIDVVAGAAPLRVALSTLKSVLDTVRVRSRRVGPRGVTGFDERRRAFGAGRFLTPADLEKRGAIYVSDVFRTVPGMRLEPDPGGGGLRILLRGTAGEPCAPSIYLNGTYMGEISADEVDSWVTPKSLTGIEIYPGGTEPPQFSRGLGGGGCGSVVIWAK